jgi:tetratricopeptide (TPR) repeat protein
MFGLNTQKNTYDDTSVVKQGGQDYGSDIHGVALRINRIIWDMLKILKREKLFGFHFSSKIGSKKTVVIMTHKDRDMLNLGQKKLHEFQDIDGMILLAKVATKSSKNSEEGSMVMGREKSTQWKSKTTISSIIITMLVISVTVYYMTKKSQEEKKVEDNTTIGTKSVDVEKNIEINIKMMNTLSKSFDNKDNKKVKAVLSQVLEMSTSTDILEKIPGYEKVEIDKDEVVKMYEDPNIKYSIKDGNGSMSDLNELAQSYAKENNITEAKSILKELIDIGKVGSKADSRHKDGIAKNLNTLGDISLDNGDIKEAEKSFSEALEIDKGLAKSSPKEYDMSVAKELTKLGAINIFLNNQKRAKRLYKEAKVRYRRIVELYRSLSKKEPQTYQPYLANSLNNLANLYLQQEQNLTKAIKPSDEALSIYRKLDRATPKKYNDFFLLTLHKTASIYNEDENFTVAMNRYNEVIDYSKEQNSTEYDEYIAKSLNALAWIHTKQSKFRDLKKAKRQLHRAIAIYKRLIKKNPKTFSAILSLSYSNLGYIAMIEEESTIALKLYKKALDIADDFDSSLSYASLLAKQKRYKDANRLFKSILKRYTKTEERAKTLTSYGEFYMNIDKEGGLRKLRESLILYNKLSKIDRFSYIKDIERVEKILLKPKKRDSNLTKES